MPNRLLLAVVAATVWVAAPRSANAQAGALTADNFFDDTRVHEIRLAINPRDWQELKANFQLNLYYPAHFTWQGVTARTVGIRSRGTGSRSGTKPGLRVDFDQYVDGGRFLGLKSVVLRNNVQDPSQLHERVSMKLFARLGIAASREAHARLFVNNEYVGLYTIVESVDKVFLERHFGQSDGYLYKYDYDADDPPHYFEYSGPDPALYSPKPFQPETHELDPDPAPIAALMRAIQETPDRDFTAVMSRYLDMGAFMVHVAVENFLADEDGIVGNYGVNNFYFYRLEESTRSLFIPWDKSEAFKGGPRHGIWHNVYDVPSWLRNRLMARAERFPELRDIYLDTLLRCADIALERAEDAAPDAPGWLEQEIARQYEQVRAAVREDAFKPHSNEEFEASIEQLIDFARTRSEFVRDDVARSR
jgi:spore coat protein CotH